LIWWSQGDGVELTQDEELRVQEAAMLDMVEPGSHHLGPNVVGAPVAPELFTLSGHIAL